jgi:UDP-glucose 4-epimerase
VKFKKALVTGSSGFLGSHIADALDEAGYQVTLFDINKSKYKRESQNEIIGDILNYKEVLDAVAGHDVVYHFAAQADIESSGAAPSETIKANIIGTQNVLDAALKEEISRLIFASTIYVYSDLGSFYRVSKQACEKIIEEYYKEFGLEYTILRYGSLYGSRANHFNSITNMLTQALTDKKIIRRGDGEEIREYIHVKDASELSVKALEDEFKNKHLIISGNQKVKVKDFLTMIKEMLKGDIDIIFGEEKELHHYQITPYSYKPEIAKKLVPENYYDLGQGVLDLLYSINEDLHEKNQKINISLRKRKNENN